MPVVRTDGLSGGQSVYGHVITKFSRMGRLLHFLTHGALLARFACESSATYTAVPLTSNKAVGPGLIPRMRDTQGIRIFKETQNNILGSFRMCT